MISFELSKRSLLSGEVMPSRPFVVNIRQSAIGPLPVTRKSSTKRTVIVYEVPIINGQWVKLHRDHLY
jgi:hypothetical protein